LGEGLLHHIFVTKWQWWAGGPALGLVVPFLYFFFNTPLGISTGYGNIIKIIFQPEKPGWLNSEKFADKWNWRFFFLAGIIAGGLLSRIFSGGYSLTVSPFEFTGLLNMPFFMAGIYFFTGGVFLGLGSRIAGGCTSGHSIHGIAQLHFPSILITAVFILFAAAAANILRLLIRGGLL